MFEADNAEYFFPEAFDQAEAIFTPTNFCKDSFVKITNKKVYVVPLGVNHKKFKFKRREWRPDKGEKFRWIFYGAPNPRKYSILEKVYSYLFKDWDMVELYIKTTGVPIESGIRELQKSGIDFHEDNGVVTSENWIFDNRYLPVDEVVKLMHSAHGGLCLHMGEGFGANALEMMSTGLPIVISDYSGTKDFANEKNAYPVKTVTIKTSAIFGPGHSSESTIPVYAGFPDEMDALTKIKEVMTNYNQAIKKGEFASQAAGEFSWDNSARKLLAAIKTLDTP
jgi:glycosyltransferase involved in cell wall biosynthesis